MIPSATSPTLLSLSLSLALSLSLSGCSPGPRAAPPRLPLAEVPLPAKAAEAAEAGVVALAERGDELLLLGRERATLLAGGEVVLSRGGGAWVEAGLLPAPDGEGSWLVGLDESGRLFRASGRGGLEPVSGRLGLGGAPVRSFCSTGARSSAFLLGGPPSFALSDGARVRAFAGSFAALSCGEGAAALRGPGSLVVLEAAGGQAASLPIAASAVAVGAGGRLWAVSGSALYAGDGRSGLERVLEASAPIGSLSAAGEGAWFSSGGELGFVEAGQASVSTGARLGPESRLVPASGGEVWVLDGARPRRFSRGGDEGRREARWHAQVRPLLERACLPCHAQRGSSGLDLATPDAWQAHADSIRKRVLVDRTMPPPGRPFGPDDRAAVQRWLDASRSP